MRPKPAPNYLAGYPDVLTRPIIALIAEHQFADLMLKRYPLAHDIRSDKTLYDYVKDIKNTYLRHANQLNRVGYDSKLHITHHALGIHTSKSSKHGAKLKAKQEIQVAALFKNMPLDFLSMIVVHELAHIKEHEHNKAFYKLCCNMEPTYHQLEFDVRIYLTYLAAGGAPLWLPNAANEME